MVTTTTLGGAAQKPLPLIPPYSDSRTRIGLLQVQSKAKAVLSIASRDHLAIFIRRALEDEFTDVGKEGWEDAFMSGLDEMGAAVQSEGWLAGLKRTRETRRKRRDVAEARIRQEEIEREERAAKEKEAESRFRTRSSKGTASTLAPAGMELTNGKKEELDAEEAEKKARTEMKLGLKQLRELVDKSSETPAEPKPLAKHLLLTVTPLSPGTHARIPLDYEGIQRSPACVFDPGVYSLPQPGAELNPEDISKVVLFGLKEWDGSYDVHSSSHSRKN